MGMPGTPIRNERLSPDARALLELLHPARSGEAARVIELREQELDAMFMLAQRHGVAPLLHRALQSAGALGHLPARIRAQLEQERRATALDNLRKYGQFQRIARALSGHDIPVIALKGLHLGELVYRDISLRPMGDLDILVPEAQVESAVAAIVALAYEVEKKISRGYDIGLCHPRSGVQLDVHWTLARPNEPYAVPLEDIWCRSVRARLGEADTRVMSTEFLLLYVCAHLSYHHFFSLDLRGLCDIAEIVRACPAIDWSIVVSESQRNGWGRGVAASLRLARDYLGVAMPKDALTAIGGESLDPQMLADAMEQMCMFAETRPELRFAPNLVGLAAASSARTRISTLWGRIFLPRAELAVLYGVPEHSARMPLYYAARVRDLVRRYAASAWVFGASGRESAAVSARKARLAKWLAGN